jgi:subtilase family serine protease
VTCKKTGTLVTPLPDLVPKGATIRVVSLHRSRQDKPQHGGLQLDVRNVGSAGAPSSKLRVKASTGDTFTATIPALAAGAHTTIDVDFDASLPAGTTYQVRLDSTNKVKESNEGNNVATVP